MKIAIDIDDCISNTLEVDFAHAWQFNKKRYPDDQNLYSANYHNAPTIFGFDKETDDEFYQKQRKAVVKQKLIYPKPYVSEVISELMKEGHEIIILTSRGDSYWGNALVETKKWLKKYKIPYSKCFANCTDKGIFCKDNNVYLMIEDNAKYAKQVNDMGIRTMILLADYNKDYINGLNSFACCWPEIYQKISGKILAQADVDNE